MNNEEDIFDINKFFNGLNVRITGTSEEPFFYATDIATILGIQNIRPVILKYDDSEVLTMEKKEKLGIKTYDKDGRINNDITLLSEFGLYRLLFNSNKDIAREFREFVYDTLRTIRMKTHHLLKEKIILLEQKELNLQEQLEKSNKKKNEYRGKSILKDKAIELQNEIIKKYAMKLNKIECE